MCRTTSADTHHSTEQCLFLYLVQLKPTLCLRRVFLNKMIMKHHQSDLATCSKRRRRLHHMLNQCPVKV